MAQEKSYGGRSTSKTARPSTKGQQDPLCRGAGAAAKWSPRKDQIQGPSPHPRLEAKKICQQQPLNKTCEFIWYYIAQNSVYYYIIIKYYESWMGDASLLSIATVSHKLILFV